MRLTVPCLFGLESLVADEMKRLDLKDVHAENGRVHCEGTLADIARAQHQPALRRAGADGAGQLPGPGL